MTFLVGESLSEFIPLHFSWFLSSWICNRPSSIGHGLLFGRLSRDCLFYVYPYQAILWPFRLCICYISPQLYSLTGVTGTMKNAKNQKNDEMTFFPYETTWINKPAKKYTFPKLAHVHATGWRDYPKMHTLAQPCDQHKKIFTISI
jgi:hypothetical protein